MKTSLGPGLAVLLAFLSGFALLRQEMLWIRATSYMTGGAPDDFGHILGAILLGLGSGALLGRALAQPARLERSSDASTRSV